MYSFIILFAPLPQRVISIVKTITYDWAMKLKLLPTSAPSAPALAVLFKQQYRLHRDAVVGMIVVARKNLVKTDMRTTSY